jgi:hypothetical protein
MMLRLARPELLRTTIRHPYPVAQRSLQHRSLVILIATVVTAAVSASALIALAGFEAVLEIFAWSGAFVAFILLVTGWAKAGAVTAGFVVTAIIVGRLIGT